MAGRSVNNPALWYTVNTPVYPATGPLSIDRNNGFVKGKVELTPNGLLIGEAGDYSVTFSAILENPVEAYTALIPVFLSLNGQFNPLDPIQSSLGGVVTLPTGFINTVQGMAVDWRRRKPVLGGVLGGVSGPAIKPIALRCVYQVARAVSVPIVGIGGIASIDGVMEFLVAGASAVQIGTANFYNPTVSMRLLDELPTALAEAGVSSVRELVGTLKTGG